MAEELPHGHAIRARLVQVVHLPEALSAPAVAEPQPVNQPDEDGRRRDLLRRFWDRVIR